VQSQSERQAIPEPAYQGKQSPQQMQGLCSGLSLRQTRDPAAEGPRRTFRGNRPDPPGVRLASSEICQGSTGKMSLPRKVDRPAGKACSAAEISKLFVGTSTPRPAACQTIENTNASFQQSKGAQQPRTADFGHYFPSALTASPPGRLDQWQNYATVLMITPLRNDSGSCFQLSIVLAHGHFRPAKGSLCAKSGLDCRQSLRSSRDNSFRPATTIRLGRSRVYASTI